MTLQCVIKLPCVRVPNLSLSIEGACHDLIAVRIVERHSVNDVRVLVQGKKLLTRIRVPYFARAIVAARDELAAVFVKRAVGQREQMGAEDLEEAEALLLVFELLFD